MAAHFLRLAIAYDLDDIREIPEKTARLCEAILIPGRNRWIYIPSAQNADDGVDWLLPSWRTADQDGRWGRWQISTDGGSGGGGGGGFTSPLTTKGDLHTYSTEDDRLPVGADGQILYADSGEATGLKWDDPPSGGSGPDLSDADPEDLGAVAAPGTSPDASRADHVHSYDGLATDAELASEASTRSAADAAIRDDANTIIAGQVFGG